MRILALEHAQVHFSIFQYQSVGLQVLHHSNAFPIWFDCLSHQQFDEIQTGIKIEIIEGTQLPPMCYNNLMH